MKKNNGASPNGGGKKSGSSNDGWVTVDKVWHVHAKRYITRKDGKPFRFPIKKR